MKAEIQEHFKESDYSFSFILGNPDSVCMKALHIFSNNTKEQTHENIRT